jgi:heme oxygenase
MDIAVSLRAATDEVHRRIEELPYAQAMVGGRLSRDGYTPLLAQLWHLHAALEAELSRRPELGGLYQPTMERAETILVDLAALGDAGPGEPTAATQRLVARIRDWATKSPWALIGCLYIFEGSRMGSMMMVRPLSASLNVSPEAGQGLDYHLDGAATRPQTWQRFKARLNALALTPEQCAAVVEGATATMNGLYDLYEAAGAGLAVEEVPAVVQMKEQRPQMVGATL